MQVQLQNELFERGAGGIENYLYYFSKTLLTLGHEPIILCAQSQPHAPANEVSEGVRIIRHPPFRFRGVLFPLYARSHEKMLQRFIGRNLTDVDLIVSRHPDYAYASCKIAPRLPVVYVQAAVWPEKLKSTVRHISWRATLFATLTRRQERNIELQTLRLCDQIIVLSHSKKRHSAEYYHLSEERFKVIPPGVDLDRFTPRQRDARLLKELGIPLDAGVILTVCRLSSEKNVQMLLKATALMDDSPCFVVVVGDGPERAHLQRLAANLGLVDRVRFTGLRTDVQRFYSIADVFVLPSIEEGFGHVFLEAMASGLPCIGLASDYPHVITASDEIIEHGRSGFCADPYSTADLAEKIDTVLKDDKLRHRLGKKSREICEKNYSWRRHVTAVMETVEKTKDKTF
jgi:glycosyltransferase involved in cell wall biosynthesis